MELTDVIRTTPTCRYYTDAPVPDELLMAVLDAARWAPSGGNRQPLRLVVVREPATRLALQNLYLPLWNAYVDGIAGGAVKVGGRPKLVADADHFAQHLADIPVLLVVCADLALVHPTDAALERLSVVGGASIYPAVQNILLAARDAGLGGALTTLLCAVEDDVKALLAVPADIATVAMVALGWPARPFPQRLQRRPLDDYVFAERFGEPFASPGERR